jgi:hypothetical protein
VPPSFHVTVTLDGPTAFTLLILGMAVAFGIVAAVSLLIFGSVVVMASSFFLR